MFIKLTNVQRAVAVGQLNAERMFEDISQTFGVRSNTIHILLSHFNQLNDVKDRQRSGYSRATSRHEDNLIHVIALQS